VASYIATFAKLRNPSIDVISNFTNLVNGVKIY
jgi:hypothetical protein